MTDRYGRFVVMSASAKVHGRAKQFGPYRHVAVLELVERDSPIPGLISDRPRQVRAIRYDSGGCFDGKTPRCAFARATADAHDLARSLDTWERVQTGEIEISPQIITRETNTERRRHYLERYGLDRYLSDVGAHSASRSARGAV